MLFISFEFIVFLILMVTVFYVLPIKVRKYWLLFGSYYFYAGTDIRLFSWLIFVTVFNFIGGGVIEKTGRNRKVYYIFWSSELLFLGLFKYLDFFEQIISNLFFKMGFSLNLAAPEVFVPLGVSFIIFQSTTYLGDIYKGKIGKQKFADCALFIAFFPTIISGPINKAHELIPQLNFFERTEEDEFKKGIFLIIVGLFEKIFVAQPLGSIVNEVYGDFLNYQSLHYIIAALCYSIQIYADFSAYSDIARGVAKLFGINIRENFNTPYLASNLVDFWKRWHMSLNAWFVEYLYIPLGGSKKGMLRKYVNILLVFIFSGLWHGANWTFVAWGVINGVLQISGQITQKKRKKIWGYIGVDDNSIIKRGIGIFCTFGIITITWIYFRSPSISTANYMIRQIFKGGFAQIIHYEDAWNLLGTVKQSIFLLVSIVLFVKIQILGKEKGKIFADYLREPLILQRFVTAFILLVLIVSLCGNYANPDSSFIYFQF